MASRGMTNKRGGSQSWIYKNKDTYNKRVAVSDLRSNHFFMNVINKITGNALTDAEREANIFNSEEAEKARQWAEDMYYRNNTISAQRKQWEDAGFNPAMAMSGGNAVQPAPTSSSSASSVSPDSSPNVLIGLLSTVINAIQNKRQMDIENKKVDNLGELQKTQGKLAETQAGLNDTKNHLEQINLKYADAEKQLSLYKIREQINNLIEDTTLKGTQVQVGKANISLMETQEALNASNMALNCQKILESEANVEKLAASANLDRWNARKIEEMLPYDKALTEAQTQLANAKTDTERTQAKLNLENASKAYVDGMAQRHMIISGYYEAQTDKLVQETLTGKAREQYLKAGTEKLSAEAQQARADATVATATVLSKVFKAYTIDLLTPGGSTTTTYNSKGEVVSSSTTVPN